MRRSLLLTGAMLAFGIPVTGATIMASAAPEATAPSSNAVTLTGSVAGAIKVAQNSQQVTFVFTEKNGTSSAKTIDIVLESKTNSSVENITCVLASGFAINSDGYDCEPGTLGPGKSASSVITATLTGASGSTVSLKACVANEATGGVGPCTTLSVKTA